MVARLRRLLGRSHGAGHHGQARLRHYLPEDATRLTGPDLLAWSSHRFGDMIVEMLTRLAAELHEVLYVYPMVHSSSARGGVWEQSWKVLSNGGITFSVKLAVQDREPGVVHWHMTDHPRLWLPPMEVPGMVPLVRRHAPPEVTEAMETIRVLQGSGQLILQGKGWRVRSGREAVA